MSIQTKDIVRAIQELSGKTDSSYAPDPFNVRSSERSNAQIMEESTQNADMEKPQDQRVGISILVSMSYKTPTETIKDRDILIRKVVHSHGDFFINGLAMDIKAPRLIKVKDITEIRDLTTGRIYQNPTEFIEQKLGIPLVADTQQATAKSDFQRVIERTGPAMTVLTYLSGLDGMRRPDERKKIMEHVRSRTTDLNYTDDEINDYLVSLAPDLESFKMALQQILSKDKSVVQSVVQSMLDVVTVDNKIADRERAFISRIIGLLEKEGFEFNLPV